MPAQDNKYFIPTRDVTPRDVELPSGGLVQVMPIDIEDLVGLGLLEQMDLLGGIVQDEHVDRVKGKKPQDRKPKKLTKAQQAAKQAEEDDRATDAMIGLMDDPKKWSPFRATIDRIVQKAVLQPQLHLAYAVESITIEGDDMKTVYVPHTAEDREQRDNSLIWTDQMDLTDKMHIFGICLPSQEKMASFRQGSAEGVGDMADVAEAEVSTE